MHAATYSQRAVNGCIDLILLFFLLRIVSWILPGSALVLLLVAFAYYALPEALWGKTPGKFFTRTRVTTASGRTPTLQQILLRTAGRFLWLDWYSYLYKEHPVGWHDLISQTRVVAEPIAELQDASSA